MRTVKDASQIDLTGSQWTRLLELQFRRPRDLDGDDDSAYDSASPHVDRTVVYLVQASAVAIPNVAGYAEVEASKVRVPCLL